MGGEFTRGHEDQRADGVFARALRCILREPLQHGQREARGLAGAGLRGAQQVASREDDRNGLGLNGGGFGITLLRDSAKQLGQEPEAFERRAYDNLLMDRPAKDFAFDTGSGRRKLRLGKFEGRDCHSLAR